jgi:hypothetical protein
MENITEGTQSRWYPIRIGKEVLHYYPAKSRRVYYSYVAIRMMLGAFDVVNALGDPCFVLFVTH